jgi:hypothetical protein
MSDKPSVPAIIRGGVAKLGMSIGEWSRKVLAPAEHIQAGESWAYGGGPASVSTLLASGDDGEPRNRTEIYEKWARMERSALCSAAMKMLVTTALGGHETTGDVVFIEMAPEAEKDKRLGAIVEDIKKRQTARLNAMAYTLCYRAANFGDSYARPYVRKGDGIIGAVWDKAEMTYPPLVQPYEQGERTIGFEVYAGNRLVSRLNRAQMVRMKMPRTQMVPQHGLTLAWIKANLEEDDPDKLPIIPAEAGGSLLYPAEKPFDRLYSTLTGLMGQRWMDSLDEQILTLNSSGMTKDQRKAFTESVLQMLQTAKARIEKAVTTGNPILERMRHIIPVWAEKQLLTISNANGGQSGRNGTISIEDVMFHAKELGGALGVDVSMMGFADLLSGGLGDGGFFRTSAQILLPSSLIRSASTDFFNELLDLDCLFRHGFIPDPDRRPWTVRHYGSVASAEAERAKTKADAMNGALLMLQAMQTAKDLGMDKQMMTNFFSKEMKMEEDDAALFATLADLKPEGEEGGEEAGGPFGGTNKPKPGGLPRMAA